MSTVVRTERIERIIQWSVELPTVIAEVSKAIAAAYQEAEALGFNVLQDDFIEVVGDDNCLILRLRLPAS